MRLAQSQIDLLWRLARAPQYVKQSSGPLRVLVVHDLVLTQKDAERDVGNQQETCWCVVTPKGMVYLKERMQRAARVKPTLAKATATKASKNTAAHTAARLVTEMKNAVLRLENIHAYENDEVTKLNKRIGLLRVRAEATLAHTEKQRLKIEDLEHILKDIQSSAPP